MRRGLPLLLALVLVVVAVAVVVARAAPRSAPSAAAPAGSCHYRVAASGAVLPDVACTPGGANPQLTREVLCAPGFSTRRYRRVSEAQKRATFARYGIASHAAGQYEVDHLVALEDGGSNEAANLWPEPAPSFHDKDVVETYVHRQVCAGVMDLAEAQQQIASDWTAFLPQATRAGLAPKAHTAEGDEVD